MVSRPWFNLVFFCHDLPPQHSEGVEMSAKDRIITLQKQLKIAKEALEKISYGRFNAPWLADNALEEINNIQFTKVGVPEIKEQAGWRS